MYYYDFVQKASADPSLYCYLNQCCLPGAISGFASEHNQPVYFPVFGCVGVAAYPRDALIDVETNRGIPVELHGDKLLCRIVEYQRYIKITKSVQAAFEESRLPYEHWPIPALEIKTMTKAHDPALDPIKISCKSDIHLAINAILGNDTMLSAHTAESFSGLSTSARNEVFLDAALALVSFAHRIAKGCSEITMIKLKTSQQPSLRKYKAILWRTLATHLRFHYRSYPGCIQWDAFKFIADHHPCAELRTFLRSSDVDTYFPEVEAAHVTVLEIPDPKHRRGGIYNANRKEIPEMETYRRWLEQTYPPENNGVPYAWEVGSEGLLKHEHVRGHIARHFRPTADILRSLELAIERGKLADTNLSPAELKATVTRWLDIPTRDTAAFYDLALRAGVNLYQNRSWRTFDADDPSSREPAKPRGRHAAGQAPSSVPATPVGSAAWDASFNFFKMDSVRAEVVDREYAFQCLDDVHDYLRRYPDSFDEEKMDDMLADAAFLKHGMFSRPKSRSAQEAYLAACGLRIKHVNPHRPELYSDNPMIPDYIRAEALDLVATYIPD